MEQKPVKVLRSRGREQAERFARGGQEGECSAVSMFRVIPSYITTF